MTELRQRMTDELRLVGHSEATLRAYLGCVRRFARHHGKCPSQLGREEIRSYLVHLIGIGRRSQTINQMQAALHFLYRQVLERPEVTAGLRRQKRRRRLLPVVLSPEEMAGLIAAVSHNLKHTAIVMALYSAGLRVSEVSGLCPTDIDSQTMQIRVRQAKGGKERRVMLSPRLLSALREYYTRYHPRDYLFFGSDISRPITRHAIYLLVRRAAENSGIAKHVTPHTLRHTFAVHLMDSGVSLRYIQQFLGHRSLRSTLIYTRIQPEAMAAVASPLDRLELRP